MVDEWKRACSWLSLCVLEVMTFSRHQKVDEMGSWLVPPIVIPILIVIMVAVYALYRVFANGPNPPGAGDAPAAGWSVFAR